MPTLGATAGEEVPVVPFDKRFDKVAFETASGERVEKVFASGFGRRGSGSGTTGGTVIVGLTAHGPGIAAEGREPGF